ncbi:metallophosphoesterase [Streptomyces sp. NPDC047108]|uniref:metallophosphoesterase n=1 Tax=Streptomyces sp. NPDC047108 TaxID=3155025 RepID=UPI0033E802F7
MVVVFLLVLLVILGLLGLVHWYLWRRLVRDTTARGGLARRVGTVAAVVLPLTTLGALIGGRAGAPFALEQVLAWPGYLWLALVLYLTLALLVGEAVRPLLNRLLAAREERASGPAAAEPAAGPDGASAVSRTRTPSAGAPAEGGDAVPVTSTALSSTAAPAAPASRPAPDLSPTDLSPADGAEPLSSAAKGTAAGSVRTETPPAVEDEPAQQGVPAPEERAVSRRLFVARSVAAAATAVAAGTVAHGAYGVLNGPAVKHVRVPLAKLPRGAHGFRIAVVSDIHLGPVLGRAHCRRIVDTVNRTQPDLIAIVGDLVDGSVSDLRPAAEPLAGLRARHGAYFVTGNHEYFSGAAEWIDHVRELGVHPLENARQELPGFDLAGVNDVSAEDLHPSQGPDFERALGDRDPRRASVLLAHQPVVVHDAVKHGVDLQLSGHTHGGQLWPGNYLAELANPTVAGLERYGDTQLYVTRGAGAWGPPVRVGAESDITVVTLASKQA